MRLSSFAVCPVILPGCILNGQTYSKVRAANIFYEKKPFCTPGECVSLSLKEQTDSDPEPSSVQRLVAGTVSGFKWESSVGLIQFVFAIPAFLCVLHIICLLALNDSEALAV